MRKETGDVVHTSPVFLPLGPYAGATAASHQI